MKPEITQQELKEYLNYNPDTGIFTWTSKIGNRGVKPDRIAGCIDKDDGYVKIRLAGVGYRAHRLAWIYMTGSAPEKFIDHKNRDRTDNRWENLREADSFQNNWNCAAMPNKIVPYKGVCWDPKRQKYYARIWQNKKRILLGRYDTAEEAHKAYCDAVSKYRGEFGYTG